MKYQIATAITTFLLAGTAVADPHVDQLADLIAKVAPASTKCADASNTECRTNVQVAPYLLDAILKYGANSNGAVAAVVALTAFESASYQYKANKVPGEPGQGTANMQSFANNVDYANSFPELVDKVAAIGLPENHAEATKEQKNTLLALVTDDKYNFGSGPWYLTQHCEPKYLKALGDATDAAWTDYITGCVSTPDTPERDALWKAAKEALGLKI